MAFDEALTAEQSEERNPMASKWKGSIVDIGAKSHEIKGFSRSAH
jgi:hypothetical protein